MAKIVLVLLLVAAVLVGAGCKTQHSGSREFVPGKGWVPTD